MVIIALIFVLIFLAIPGIIVGAGLAYAWVKCKPIRLANMADQRVTGG